VGSGESLTLDQQTVTPMLIKSDSAFSSVYGPVNSWRYGRSLGIDPIGQVSTCSFDCVYCQLGAIERVTSDRTIFVPTDRILHDLQPHAPWDVDTITLSGSGEPTLALNLEDIMTGIQTLTHKPIAVLTNGTQLGDPSVRQALAKANKISLKLDGVTPDQLRRVNRPAPGIRLDDLLTTAQQFRSEFSGELAIQTMILVPWNNLTRETYIQWMRAIAPDEIQLNTPSRPQPLQHELEARGNHSQGDRPYPVRIFRQVSTEVLRDFADEIRTATGIPVRHPLNSPK
jgi:wyosine [tRNA(Phe)-imidazoG37] synthetase (radical SAM superfamily)